MDESAQIAHVPQGQNRDQKAGEEQNDDLHEVRPGRGFQATVNGINAGRRREENDVPHDGGNGIAKQDDFRHDPRQILPKKTVEHDAPRIERAGIDGGDEADD